VKKTLPYVISSASDQCIMYASDYPHPDSKSPNSVAPIQKADISAVAKKRILEENAAQLYGLGDAWRGGTEAAMCELVRCNQLV
jgi:predicted TIM-barrel fold metal-dependent hydrolase